MVTICGVDPKSIAERAGFAAGDVLAAIDGHPIQDVLDYRFYMTNACITLEGATAAGQPFCRKVRKGQYDDLGLQFATYLMDKQHSCRNKCIFCFIDQLPAGLRDSLYFKDDDSRLSFLFGNYITLTNLQPQDVQRIIDMRISPVNVSVHTMNPELRVRMMGNRHAGEVLRYLPRLTGAGIAVNAQLVLCPGVNDGQELEYSLRELCALAPALQSIAVVPVGLTRYREKLPDLRLFTPGEARAVIAAVNRFGEEMLARHGQRTCYAADEFYLAAGLPLPPAAFYEGFDQLENGVGLLALLEDEFSDALLDAAPLGGPRRISIATGTAAAPLLARLARDAMRACPELHVEVFPIANRFFGETVTVAGLVTGGDLQAQLHGCALGDQLLIPAAMLRHEGDLFLDGVPLEDLAQALGVPICPVPNDGYALFAALSGQ